jgi:hypothetical protein
MAFRNSGQDEFLEIHDEYFVVEDEAADTDIEDVPFTVLFLYIENY